MLYLMLLTPNFKVNKRSLVIVDTGLSNITEV